MTQIMPMAPDLAYQNQVCWGTSDIYSFFDFDFFYFRFDLHFYVASLSAQ